MLMIIKMRKKCFYDVRNDREIRRISSVEVMNIILMIKQSLGIIILINVDHGDKYH